jgi:methylmalonyl-CoA mutase
MRHPAAAADALSQVLMSQCVDRQLAPAEGSNLGVDPIASALRGHPVDDVQGVLEDAATLAREVDCLAWVVDGTAVHDLGASDAQELGYSLAVGAAYLRLAGVDGRRLGRNPSLMEFRYAATGEQFTTIAKLRAARRLWARVLELSGAKPEARGQRQHAVTSRPMMGKYDPWVNLLRTTVGAFAAGVGGAEAVTVLPFDSPLGVPDAFGRRIARNTSSLLISESHVAKVVDPAGGSYAVEKLTDDLARAAWEEFGRIEATRAEGASGIQAALSDGSLRARVGEVAARRDHEIAHRTRPLTGVSEFPNLAEHLPERAPSPAADEVRRYGAPYEQLRDDPVSTPVFLATMGAVAAHTARATFATNLLAAGGVPVAPAGATDGVDAVLSSYDGQRVVCLAGTDAAYADWGADLVAALRDRGATHVVLAGRPGERTVPPDLVDDSCASGGDALAFLHRTREALG